MRDSRGLRTTSTIFGDGLKVEDRIFYPIVELSITKTEDEEGKGLHFLFASASPLAILVAETLGENKQIEYVVLPLLKADENFPPKFSDSSLVPEFS